MLIEAARKELGYSLRISYRIAMVASCESSIDSIQNDGFSIPLSQF